MSDNSSNADYWRAIVLYGLNVATYKIALAKCLYGFSKAGITNVSMQQLAQAFFYQYRERLQNGMPHRNKMARITQRLSIPE